MENTTTLTPLPCLVQDVDTYIYFFLFSRILDNMEHKSSRALLSTKQCKRYSVFYQNQIFLKNQD